MSILTNEEQHEGRNAVLSLAGILLYLKKKSPIEDQIYLHAKIQLSRLEEIFNKGVQDGKI